MADSEWLAAAFEEHRDHLRAVAYRMLGSSSDADDAVQEAWVRFARTDTGAVENLRAWLTTVVSRVCLDMLRARVARREDSLDPPPHRRRSRHCECHRNVVPAPRNVEQNAGVTGPVFQRFERRVVTDDFGEFGQPDELPPGERVEPEHRAIERG